MTRFKICGLRDLDNTLVAAQSGADFIGFNFVPGAKRAIPPELAKSIIDSLRARVTGPMPNLVGLFANQPIEDVNRILKQCGLDYAQLCGDESPAYWARVEAKIVRQVKVKEHPTVAEAVSETMEVVGHVAGKGHIPLLDKYETGALGGTGRTFDWDIAREVAKRYEIMLAGGITPENVSEAIHRVGPWAVDVSSGVETDGAKDPRKIEAFAAMVKGTDLRQPL
ncbi:MAG: phosphoribosylanthranilate isomerase [SAR202 cluster bacterium]|nr:phosphoribosylanthranilate isomerase [SAR202 cluster bacterium]